MTTLEQIKAIYPNAEPLTDFVLRDDGDGNGSYIDSWNLADPMPCASESIAAHKRRAEQFRVAALAVEKEAIAIAQSAVAEALAAKDAAEAALAANITYQQQALDFAKEVITAGDLDRLPEVLAFAGASFAERERNEKLTKAAALKAEAEALEAAANS